MVHFETCEICGKHIEVEGNEPHRCQEHTQRQMENQKRKEIELNIVDYLICKYGYSPVGF